MAISAISGSASSPPSAASTAIGLQDFLKILLTQLNYQDPLKPLDNQAFMAQMAQFTALEQSQRLNDKLDLLISNQSAFQSVSLLGRTVDVSTSSGNVTGMVSALSLQGDQPTVTVTTSTGTVLPALSLSQVSAVR